MCFEHDAHPPPLPFAIAGGAGDGRSIALLAADGNRFPAYLAMPAREAIPAPDAGGPSIPPGTGIVVIPDIRGLVPYYEALALSFAEVGLAAVAVDLYARSAKNDARGPDFDGRAHAAQTTQAGIAADVAAAIAHLRSPGVGATGALFTVGFCFGGRASLLQAIEPHGLAGVIGFYGFPTGPSSNRSAAPADVAGRFRCAVLGLYGGADRGIPPEAVDAFGRALQRAGVEHEIVLYPDAPHSFFDRLQDRYAQESADAWRKTLSFIARHAAT